MAFQEALPAKYYQAAYCQRVAGEVSHALQPKSLFSFVQVCYSPRLFVFRCPLCGAGTKQYESGKASPATPLLYVERSLASVNLGFFKDFDQRVAGDGVRGYGYRAHQ